MLAMKSRFALGLLVYCSIGNALRTDGWTVSPNHTHGSTKPCIFDYREPWAGLKLLDPKDGLPFTNVRGSFQKTMAVLDNLPVYSLERPASTDSGVFDITLGDDYLALFDDGTLAFAPLSSNGPLPRALARKSYITSIFAISCNGELSISIPDMPNYGFARHNDTRHTYIHHTKIATDSFNRHSKHKRAPHIQFVKRTMSATDIENATLNSFAFLAGPALISDKHQRGGAPRCPKQVPFGLTSVVRPGARETYYNGCGAENGVKVPALLFEDCCNVHDLCYDDCTSTWELCNDNFRDCNHAACAKGFPEPPANASWWSDWRTSRWGCHTLADTYADFVDSTLGKWSFNLTNEERCTCRCPDDTFDCGKYCMVDCEAINEDAVVPIHKGNAEDYTLKNNSAS